MLAYALLNQTSVRLREVLRLSKKEIRNMLWTILVILLVLWLLGFIGGVGGSLIHLILLIALVILIINLVSGRRGPVV